MGVAEKRTTINLPADIYDILEEMCYAEVDGVRVKTKQMTDVIRELIVQGLKAIMAESG